MSTIRRAAQAGGHGPTLLARLPKPIDSKLVGRLELGSGVVAMRYEPGRLPAPTLTIQPPPTPARHSGSIPAALTILPHFVDSPSWNFASSCGVDATGSVPVFS